MLSLARRYPCGLVLAACVLLGSLLASTRMPSPEWSRDAVSRVDNTASLIYLTLPLLAMVACLVIRLVHRPLHWETLGVPSVRRWRLDWVGATALLAMAAPVVVTIAICALTRDWAADRTSLAVYTAVQSLWLGLVVVIATLVERAVPSRFAPVVSAFAVGLPVAGAQGAMYALGASVPLAGTMPERSSWLTSIVILTTVVVLLALVYVLGVPRLALGLAVAAAPIGLIASPAPGRVLAVASLADTCIGGVPSEGVPSICAYPQYVRWMDETNNSVGLLRRFVESQGGTLPVDTYRQRPADAHPPPERRVVQLWGPVAGGRRGATVEQVAEATMGGMACLDKAGTSFVASGQQRAVAAWVTAGAIGTPAAAEQFHRGWPEFDALTPTQKQAALHRVLDLVATCPRS